VDDPAEAHVRSAFRATGDLAVERFSLARRIADVTCEREQRHYFTGILILMTLAGKCIRLEPLEHRHADDLVVAAAVDPSLYQWSLVPQGLSAVSRYIDTALAWRDAGTAVPFAIVRLEDGAVVGSTRFWNVERWAWPEGHPRHGRQFPDACEIGHTWLTRSAIRTGVNTEAKLLLLTHAFETWGTLRVCFHTDARNLRSQAALERIGGRREGTLRAHRMAADYTPRDSIRYSILPEEWPEVKRKLQWSGVP
jgi:N-acetyltransferase